MSIFNEAALSTSKYIYANTAARSLTLPFTMACWVYPQALASAGNNIWGYSTADDSDGAFMFFNDMDTSFVFEALRAGGGTELAYSAVSPFPTFDIWYFFIGIVTSGEVRTAILNSATGAITQGSPLVAALVGDLSVTSTGFQILINSGGPGGDAWGGAAECWSAGLNADSSNTGTGVIDPVLIRQLAYYGPFSVPHIAAKVWEYHSLKECLPGAGPQQGTYYGNGHSSNGVWITDGGGGPAVLGQHPPLPGGYVTPAQYIQNLTI